MGFDLGQKINQAFPTPNLPYFQAEPGTGNDMGGGSSILKDIMASYTHINPRSDYNDVFTMQFSGGNPTEKSRREFSKGLEIGTQLNRFGQSMQHLGSSVGQTTQSWFKNRFQTAPRTPEASTSPSQTATSVPAAPTLQATGPAETLKASATALQIEGVSLEKLKRNPFQKT